MGSSVAATTITNRSPCLIGLLFVLWTLAEVRAFVPESWRCDAAFFSPSLQRPRPARNIVAEKSTTTSTATTTQRHHVEGDSDSHDDMRQLYRTVAEQDPEWFQKFVVDLLGEDDDILDEELIALAQRRRPNDSRKTEVMNADESSVIFLNFDDEEDLKAGGAGQKLQEDEVSAEESQTVKSLLVDVQPLKEDAMTAARQTQSNSSTAVNTTTSTQQTVDNDAETDAETLRKIEPLEEDGTMPMRSRPLSYNDSTSNDILVKANDRENDKQTETKEEASITSAVKYPIEPTQEAKTRDSATAIPKATTTVEDTLVVENNINGKPPASDAFSASNNTTTDNNYPATQPKAQSTLSPGITRDDNDRIENAFDHQAEEKTTNITASQPKDKSFATMKEQSTTPTANTANAAGDDNDNDDRTVLFRDAFGRGWKRVPLSVLAELGYKAGEITALQPDALDLIVQDGIRKPRTGVPSRWTVTKHASIGNRDATVKIIAASELETKPETSDPASVATTGMSSSTMNKEEQTTPPGATYEKKTTVELKPPESNLDTEQRISPEIPAGAASQVAAAPAPTEPHRSNSFSDQSSKQAGELLGDGRRMAERQKSEKTESKQQILKQPRHESSSARQRQDRPSELDEEVAEKISVTKSRANKHRSRTSPWRPSPEVPPRERRRTRRGMDSQKTVYSVRPGPSFKRSKKIERDDPPVSSRLWPDMDTFRNLLRNEAELRLRILGDNWTDAVKEEADWRHDLYKNWLWTLHRGVGEPFVESRSDRARRRRRTPPPGSNPPRERTNGAPPSTSTKRVRER